MNCLRRLSEYLCGEAQIEHTRLSELPSVALDTSHMGTDVVIVKNGRRICGTGAAIANAPLVQDKSYFEVKIGQNGVWALGVAQDTLEFNSWPLGPDSWVLRNDGNVYQNNTVKASVSQVIEEGDVLGVSFDHLKLNFHLNGEEICSIGGVKGTVYPVAFVDDGAILDLSFNTFYHRPPEGFQPIMIEQTLL